MDAPGAIVRFCGLPLRSNQSAPGQDRASALLPGLRGSPCFSVLKSLLACLWDRRAGPELEIADAKRCAWRAAPAVEAVSAQTAAGRRLAWTAPAAALQNMLWHSQ